MTKVEQLEKENAAWKAFADKVEEIIHADYNAEQLKYRDIRYEYEKTKRIVGVNITRDINPLGIQQP